VGQRRFEAAHQVDLMAVVASVLHYRLTGRPLTVHLVQLESIEEYVLAA
jgi:hypothetical protein